MINQSNEKKTEEVQENKQLTKKGTKNNDLDKKTKDVNGNTQVKKRKTKDDDLEIKTKHVNENKQLIAGGTENDDMDKKTKDVNKNTQVKKRGTKNNDLEIKTKHVNENKQLIASETENDDMDKKTKDLDEYEILPKDSDFYMIIGNVFSDDGLKEYLTKEVHQMSKSLSKSSDLDKKTKDVNGNTQVKKRETENDDLDIKTKHVSENKQLTASGTKNDDMDIKTKHVNENKQLTESGTKNDDMDKKTKDVNKNTQVKKRETKNDDMDIKTKHVNENKQLTESGTKNDDMDKKTKDLDECEPLPKDYDSYMIVGNAFTDDSIKKCLSKEIHQMSKSLRKSSDLDKKIEPIHINKQTGESLAKYIRRILVIVNSFLYIIIGLCFLLVGIYLCFMKVGHMNSMKIYYFIILTGCFIILTGACGCYGAIFKRTYLLIIFIIFGLLIFESVLYVTGILYRKECQLCKSHGPSDYSKGLHHILKFTNRSNMNESIKIRTEVLKNYLVIFVGVVISVALIEIIALIYSIRLCYRVRNSQHDVVVKD